VTLENLSLHRKSAQRHAPSAPGCRLRLEATALYQHTSFLADHEGTIPRSVKVHDRCIGVLSTTQLIHENSLADPTLASAGRSKGDGHLIRCVIPCGPSQLLEDQSEFAVEGAHQETRKTIN
jgi:hypothetical protein